MRFYVPEWDDRVDADYDFRMDLHPTSSTQARELAYIWDLFEPEDLPIDGVLISREQVASRSADRREALDANGIYAEGQLGIPGWLPTISDCGAWGYKTLPFPPYDNEEMLAFYDRMDVEVGVTIDHLVLGSGDQRRLYLDRSCFTDTFAPEDLRESLTDAVSVMIADWPDRWPPYVEEVAPRLTETAEPFTEAMFTGSVDEVIESIRTHPRAVYRPDDAQFRYERTLANAEEMWAIHRREGYPYRLMAVIQGWDLESYQRALQTVLAAGFRYVGIGGVAGSRADQIRELVDVLGRDIKAHTETTGERVDVHIFGFAKEDVLEDIGARGVTSFDSASMLRAAWTGPNNYHLHGEGRYDAIRVRYPSRSAPISRQLTQAARARVVLLMLQAYDRGDPITEEVRGWVEEVSVALDRLPDQLQTIRRGDDFDEDAVSASLGRFDALVDEALVLRSAFGRPFRRQFVRQLRSEADGESVPWTAYLEVVTHAHEALSTAVKQLLGAIDPQTDAVEQITQAVGRYAETVGDAQYVAGYRRTLIDRPWRRCTCPICSTIGIDVAIFRGNDRNRRRGFHNMHQFHKALTAVMPRVVILFHHARGFETTTSMEGWIADHHPSYWGRILAFPQVDVAVVTPEGAYEWWDGGSSKGYRGPVSLERYLKYDTVLSVGEHATSTDAPGMQRLIDGEMIGVEDPQQLHATLAEMLGRADQVRLSRFHS